VERRQRPEEQTKVKRRGVKRSKLKTSREQPEKSERRGGNGRMLVSERTTERKGMTTQMG
jgi:hypothetical protein